MLFTAPLFNHPVSSEVDSSSAVNISSAALPGFNASFAATFFKTHGLAVRAVGINVEDLKSSYDTVIANGAIACLPPTLLVDESGKGSVMVAEVGLYGDVVLRLMEAKNFSGLFLPNFKDSERFKQQEAGRYGIFRFDHIVGNVYSLPQTMQRLQKFTVI